MSPPTRPEARLVYAAYTAWRGQVVHPRCGKLRNIRGYPRMWPAKQRRMAAQKGLGSIVGGASGVGVMLNLRVCFECGPGLTLPHLEFRRIRSARADIAGQPGASAESRQTGARPKVARRQGERNSCGCAFLAGGVVGWCVAVVLSLKPQGHYHA